MGLRFRKSITLLPGVKLNISKSGVGVSAGIPGLRGSINTSGRATGTVGIPGTGVSYVKTKKIFGGKKSDTKSKTAKADSQKALGSKSADEKKRLKAPESNAYSAQIDENTLRSIHGASDVKIDWQKIASQEAPLEGYSDEAWAYLREAAPKILTGDIDAYLQVIADIDPLDDLLDYGSGFEFGTDDPDRIEVEFVINSGALENARMTMKPQECNALLQDFVCSVSLRIARDMFALLPVSHTVVHAVLEDATVFSVDYDAAMFSKINFAYIDASNTATKFRNNMKFDPKNGFFAVNRL